MNRSKFGDLMDSVYDDLKRLNRTKGHDYAGDNDALANFKTAAERVGLNPTQVWGVYFLKHIAAIETYVKDGQVESEPIEGRIKDAILYLFLLMGLVVESNTPSIAEIIEDQERQSGISSPGALADTYNED